MDVPTRQSYVMAVVRPEERLARRRGDEPGALGAWAVAPAFAGLFMQRRRWACRSSSGRA